MTRSETIKLTVADVMPPAEYEAQRREFRTQVMEYKRSRMLALGPSMTLSFENRHTIRYQVQEALRLQQGLDAAAIQAELDAFNPFIPDGTNWKASCFVTLESLRGAEQALWVQAAELPKLKVGRVLDLSADGESPIVHFVRFDLDALQLAVVRAGAPVRFGVDHPDYRHEVLAPEPVRQALLADVA